MTNQTLISIDVGIKNLGICIFSIDNSNQTVKVLLWQIVSLLSNQNEFCQCTLKSGSNCKSKAKYVSNGIFCCARHVSSSNTSSLISHSNSNLTDLVSIGRILQQKLDFILQDLNLNIDIVLIENQISPIANRMKTIQGMIMQYFINIYVPTIVNISSKNKLKIFHNILPPSSNYKERKQMGIQGTKSILQANACFFPAQPLFTGSKLDDLADCFLQGIYYITSIINIAIHIS